MSPADLITKLFGALNDKSLIEEDSVSMKIVKKEFRRNVHIRKYRFQEFLQDMVNSHVIVEFDEDKIYLDENYLENLENEMENSTVCSLCSEKIKSQQDLTNHESGTAHTLRFHYLNKKSIFTDLKDFNLIDVETKCPHNCIQTKFKKKINVRMELKNVSDESYQICSIIKLNRHTPINIRIPKFKRLFLPNESIEIMLMGYFRDTTSFDLPITILAKKENTTFYILKEIKVNLVPEKTVLGSENKFIPKQKSNFELTNETIIPGEKPIDKPSEYKDVIRLGKYQIPQELNLLLTEHANKYPDFLKKHQSIEEYSFINSANELNVPIKIKLENYCNMLSLLLNIEEFQMIFDIRDYDTISSLNKIGDKTYRLEVPGLAESRPSLLRYDSVFVKENENSTQKFEGIVHRTQETAVYLGFSQKFSDVFIDKKQFFIQFSFNRRPIKVEKQAVKLIAEHEVIQYFFPKNIPTAVLSNARFNYYNRSLNEEQKQAISNLMEIKNAPYLIFGPPGTGKTVTIIEAVLQIWRTKPESKILVCAPSNSSVNEIAVRLADKIPVAEIYRLFSPRSKRDILSPSLEKISNINENNYFMPSIQTLSKYRIVLTTLITAARLYNGGIASGHFSYVFIDESGYATESETLVPIAGIFSSEQKKQQISGQLILVGDPRQLGPILHSNFVKFCGFDISMLERLIDTCAIYARNETDKYPYDQRYITKLLNNYRSHPAILEVSNKLFYHKELVAVGNDYTNIFARWEHLPTKNFPVIFHNVHGTDEREKNSPSFFNNQEIEEVMNYLSKLIDSRVSGMKITEDHIGVITPYRKQVEKIKAACKVRQWNKLLVGSVEQFQGCEKLIIIISAVRSNNANNFTEIDKKHQLGFVRNRKRFNVAVTRAKALMIVIGNADVLNTDIYWRTFIKNCDENKSCLGRKFSFEDIPIEDEDVFVPEDLDVGNDGADFSRTNE